MARSASVKYFKSDFPGAPVLSGQAGALASLLDACLVNGFGLKSVDTLVVLNGIATMTISSGHSFVQHAVALVAGATPSGLNGEKRVISTTASTVVFDATGITDQTATGAITTKVASAGWEKAYTGENKAVYRSPNVASARLYFRVDDAYTTAARINMYESMTDIDTGVGKSPTDAQISGGGYLFKSNVADSTARPWVLVASDSTVYLFVFYYTQSLYAAAAAGFGDFKSRKAVDAYKSFLRHNHHANNAASTPYEYYSIFGYSPVWGSVDTYHLLARDFTGVGGTCSYRASAFYGTPAGAPSWYLYSGNGSVPYPNGPDYGLVLTPIHLLEGSSGSFRGKYLGIFSSPQTLIQRVCPDARTPVVIEGVPGYPDRAFAAVPYGYNSAISNWAVGFIDITGPWE